MASVGSGRVAAGQHIREDVVSHIHSGLTRADDHESHCQISVNRAGNRSEKVHGMSRDRSYDPFRKPPEYRRPRRGAKAARAPGLACFPAHQTRSCFEIAAGQINSVGRPGLEIIVTGTANLISFYNRSCRVGTVKAYVDAMRRAARPDEAFHIHGVARNQGIGGALGRNADSRHLFERPGHGIADGIIADHEPWKHGGGSSHSRRSRVPSIRESCYW